MNRKYQKTHISASSVHKYQKLVFLADLTVLRLITTVWAKMSQNSYLREFCAQVSQIVFLADLTVLRLITILWAEMSRDSYLREFCAQVSQIVFQADLTVLRLIRTVSCKNVTKLISPRVLCTSITNRVLSWFDRFTAYYYCMSRNITKLISSASSVLKYQRSCFKLIWPFYRLLKLYDQKCHKTHISASSVHKYKKYVFLDWFDRFTAYYNCMSKNVTKLISPRVLCTSITNRVLRLFDCFKTFYNCMSENITKLISPRVLCTSVTNRVLSWFDRFTAYYNCMSKNVTKLISPRVLCTSITNRVLSWFDRFTAY